MQVTVIISTHRRNRELGELLADLAGQDYPLDQIEVIVVDSVEGDDVSSVLNGPRSVGLDVSLEIADNVLASKRNRGAAVARAPSWSSLMTT